jgi:ABC transport system ATP-binding/permease protein
LNHRRRVKELEELPASIEKMEAEQRALAEAMNDPVFFKQDAASTSLHQQKIATLTKQLERTYARWEELTELEAQSSR